MTNLVAAALVSAVGFAGVAEASVWEVFQARCLVPMEQGDAVQPADLTPVRSMKNDGDTYSEYVLDGDVVKLTVHDGGGIYPQSCRVEADVEANDEKLADRFKEWRAQPDISARYGENSVNPDVLLAQSTGWREPAIAISLDMTAAQGRVTLKVEEIGK